MNLKALLATSFLSIPKQLKEEFSHELFKKNVWIGKFLLPLIALYELYNILYLVFVRTDRINSFPGNAYLTLYVLLFTISIIFLIIAHSISKRNITSSPIMRSFAVIFVSFLALWGTSITLLDLRNTDSVHVYLIITISIAATIYIRPRSAILLFTINQAILWNFFETFQRVDADNSGNYINTTFAVLIAISISISRYYNMTVEFNNRQIIIKQNNKLDRLNQELQKLAVTDPLSDLYNRRFLDAALLKEWEKCRSDCSPITVLMIDIDNFKTFNDYYGHKAGDGCIEQVAEVMLKCTEGLSACSFRYGGEEFTILLTELNSEQAYQVAELIRTEVHQLKIMNQTKTPSAYVTISTGMYHGIPASDLEPDDLLKMADAALYEAKARGKNQVVMYNEEDINMHNRCKEIIAATT
ncbi:GGDEF domain-containing protein [Paenibacillus marinisediminis]